MKGDNIPNDEAQATSLSLSRRFFRPETFVSFAFAFALLLFLVTRVNVDIQGTVAIIRNTDPILYVAALIVYYVSFPIRAWRWRQMLENTGCSRKQLPGIAGLSEIIFLSWFANCIVPAKLGDLYRGYLAKKNAGLSFSRVVGTIVAERVIDFGVLLAMMGIAGVISFHGKVPSEITTVFVMGAGAVALVALVLLAMRGVSGGLERFLPARVHDIYGRFHEGALRSFRFLPFLGSLTVAAWLMEAARVFLVTRAINRPLSPDLTMELVMAVFIALGSALLTAVPGTPAGLGYAEFGVSLALVLYGFGSDVAFSIAVLDRTLSYWSVVLFGLVTYILSKKK